MLNNYWDLSGKIALITGSTHGIGKAIAEIFLKKGASVYITARRKPPINELLLEWKKAGYSAYGMSCDMLQSDNRERLVTDLNKVWGKLDILVNNVGPNFKKPFHEYTLPEYQSLIEGNITSAFHLTQLCYPLLKESDQASIINISGVSSTVAFKGSGPYGIAKAGLESFTRTLAVECGEHGIRSNAIIPGFIATETLLKKYDDAYLNKATNRIPLQRMGSPEDIANLACFLAMPASAYINGQCITIDGGFTSYGFGGP